MTEDKAPEAPERKQPEEERTAAEEAEKQQDKQLEEGSETPG